MLIWQCSARGRSWRGGEVWSWLVSSGFAGLAAVFLFQLVLVWPPLAAPVIPEDRNRTLLFAALWMFCFPVVWGFSMRFLPSFLGLRKSHRTAVFAGLVLLAGAIVWPPLTIAAAAAACFSLRIFEPVARAPKVAGVDPRYPLFARLAFAWLLISAVLGQWAESKGLTGASRHAFTVGFLATIIFAIGPRLLPSFLNSRELWSRRLMLAAMALLAAGCTLRVVAEPLAYAGIRAGAWQVLPVSACLELTAVLLFAFNIAATLAAPMPAWVVERNIHENLPLYWYVSAYPGTRRILAGAGLKTLRQSHRVPRSLTLREAAAADGVDCQPLVALLRDYFRRRLARSLRPR